MYKYLKFLKSDLKKRKIFSFTILILSFFSILTVSTVVNALKSNSEIYDERYKNNLNPDSIISYKDYNYRQEFFDEIKEKDDIEEISSLESFSTTIKNKESDESAIFINSSANTIYKEKIKDGDIILPEYHYKNMNYKINDFVDIQINSTWQKYRVVGFFEDSIFGSPIIKYKKAFISPTDYEKINNTGINKNILLYIKWKEKVKKNESISTINEKNFKGKELSYNADFIYDKDYIKKAYTIIPTIVSVMLILAAFLILISLMMVLKYSIVTTIEMDRSEIAVKKTFGMRDYQIQIEYILVNFLIAAIGCFFGYILSLFITKNLTNFYLEMNGLYKEENNFVDNSIGIVIVFMIVLLLNIKTSIKKTKKIAPVQAIKESNQLKIKNKNYFFITSYENIFLNFKITLKQFITRFRSYTALFTVTVIFVFLLLSVFSLNSSFSEKKDVYKILGIPENDIILISPNQVKREEITKEISKNHQISYQSRYEQANIEVEEKNVIGLIYDNFDNNYNNIEGKVPEGKEDLIITQALAKKISKKVNDYIYLTSINGEKIRFKVTGIYETVNNVGLEIQILESGYKIVNPSYLNTQTVIRFNDRNEDKKEIISENEGKLNGVKMINASSSSDNLIYNIQDNIKVISFIVLASTLFVLSVISFLLTNISIKQEKKDLLILRTLGFTKKQLVNQYILRIIITVILGILSASFIFLIFGNMFIKKIMNSVELTGINTSISLIKYLGVVIIIIFINYFVAKIAARDIKKN